MLRFEELSYKDLRPYTLYPLQRLKKQLPKDEETFYSEEVTVKTRFGSYKVSKSLFQAEGYNEYLAKMVDTVTNATTKLRGKNFPIIQVQKIELVRLLDEYIRHRLFEEEFNPMENNNWRILLLQNTGLVSHIYEELNKTIYKMHQNIDIEEARVEKRYFSEIKELTMREKFSIELSKTIYERLSYPSNKGELEKNFMIFADRDSNVEAFIKIHEYKHTFANVMYIRSDGLLSSYYPDFLIKTKERVAKIKA